MNKRSTYASLLGVAALLLLSERAEAFVVKYWCNGSPIPVSTSALNFKYLTASLPTSAVDAANKAIDVEINGLTTVGRLSHYNDPYGTTVTLNNGINEVARVPRSAIGGNGVNFIRATTCVFSSTIVENDVMVADDLETTAPQDNWLGNNVDCRNQFYGYDVGGNCDIGLGAFTFLHEFEHTLNLEHNVGQVVLHNGPPVPYGGSSGGAASPATYFPDDVAGLRWALGNVAYVRNVMSSSSHVINTDTLKTNAGYGAGWGVVYYFCPGNSFPFWTTVANNGVTNETIGRRVFFTTSPANVNASTGWLLASWYSTSINAGAISAGSYILQVPSNTPRNQFLWMHHQVDTGGIVYGTRWTDNISSYPFVLSVGSVAACGR